MFRRAAGFFAIVWLAACHKSEPERPLQAVRIESVASVASQSLTPYSGLAMAETQIDLSFKVGGYVQSIATVKETPKRVRPLQAGDLVKQGTLLAELREGDFRAKVAELGGMRGDAASAYSRAKADYERAQTLITSGAISQAEYDNAKARFGSAAGAVAAANARVSEAGLALADSRLKAPFDGTVLSRGIEVGALVAPGTVAFTIADMSSMRIVFGVPDTVQRLLAIDQSVVVSTDALPTRTFAGRITKLAAQADPKTRLFDVEATVDNEDGALKVGMVMQVQLNMRHDAAVEPKALIPLSAVVRPPNKPAGFASYVVKMESGGETAHLRTIELGDLVANRVAVTAGLGVGDEVVVQGATLLTDGERVNVVP
jgi:membrane fusion protein, multidrug efflux system